MEFGPKVFGPKLMTLEQFVELVGAPKTNVVIDVFELNKLEPDQAQKVRKDHQLDEERSEDIYQVDNHLRTKQWQFPRSIPGLLFESGLDLARPYVVTFGYGKDVVACVPRVVEDNQEVPVIGHIHWSGTSLRKLGIRAPIKSMWRVTGTLGGGETSDNPIRLSGPVAGEAKPKKTIDFSRYTDRARKVMGVSRSAALDYKSSHINSGLLLVGLAREGSGVAANVLKATLDVKGSKEVKTFIEETYSKLTQPSGTIRTIGAKIPFSPGALEALQLAQLEAEASDHNYIGTEHLLLGIAQQEESIGKQMLVNLGLLRRDLRSEVSSLLG